MVARIKIGSSLNRAFFYNENKQKEGVAECIMAQNYPADLERLSEHQRLNVLQKVASLNPNIKVNSVHISLNFDPSEQPSVEQLKEIASIYMDQIGFGQQPYLVYQHHDAGHPHIHLLTTKVGLDGKGINTHNIGKTRSETVRKAIEIQFGLVKAEDMKPKDYSLKPAYVQQVHYGKTESRKAIATVLNEVLKNYKYTSLPELNVVLHQYNVHADRGTEQSRTFKNNGLFYRIQDDKGLPVGVPIKASSFAEKPTLKYLEEHFKINETTRLPFKGKLKNAIDLFFLRSAKPSIPALIKALDKEGIHTVLRQSESGQLYGITYVDHRNKCVFNGSALGKEYSAKAIQEQCNVAPISTLNIPSKSIQNQSGSGTDTTGNKEQSNPISEQPRQPSDSLLDILMQTEYGVNYVPYQLSGKKKKRKRKGKSQ